MRSALQRVFSLGGYQVELYESGMMLLESADLVRPGCILLDMLMPGTRASREAGRPEHRRPDPAPQSA